MSREKSGAAARFLTVLKESRRLSRKTAADGGLDPHQVMLSHWQTMRLRDTYMDFYVQKRFRSALDFFLSDIYGPTDFSQRDSDIERVYPIMVKVLSAPAIQSLAKAMELHTMSMKLDAELAAVLVEELGVDHSLGLEAFTPDQYAAAYRHCDNYAARKQQIELVQEVGSMLDEVVKMKMIYATVRVARRPAKLAGFGELQSFIERGLSSFRKMKTATPFLDAMRERETYILDQIFADAAASTWMGDAARENTTAASDRRGRG